jgi:hypothetical protein
MVDDYKRMVSEAEKAGHSELSFRISSGQGYRSINDHIELRKKCFF